MICVNNTSSNFFLKPDYYPDSQPKLTTAYSKPLFHKNALRLKYYMSSPRGSRARVQSPDSADGNSSHERRLTLYEKLYLDEYQKVNRNRSKVQTAGLTGRIEANKTGVLLHSRGMHDNSTRLSLIKVSDDRYIDLEGSEKERCQRNAVKIQLLKERIEKAEGDYSQQARIALAVCLHFPYIS